jgi:hypothetical protein
MIHLPAEALPVCAAAIVLAAAWLIAVMGARK